MHCTHPPALTDDQITALLEDEADSLVRLHVSQCAACAGRVTQAHRLEQHLYTQLHRWDCPPIQQLSAYHLHALPAPQRHHVAEHVAQCTRCDHDLQELAQYLTPTDGDHLATHLADPLLYRHIGEIVAHVVPQSATPSVRGLVLGLMAEAGTMTIFLDALPAAEDRVEIKGQLVAEDQETWTGALVELLHEGTVKSVTTVDDVGSFIYAPIPFGEIALKITPRYGYTVVLPNMNLRARAAL